MKATTFKCPSCSAPVDIDATECEFCGIKISKTINGKIITPVKDFGIKNFLPAILIIGIGIYIYGWYFEDTKYWLNDTAIIIWSVMLPIWIILSTIIWKNKWGAILYGIIFSIAIFIFHFLIIAYYRSWHFNDDYFGIAGMFSGIILGAWLLGRLFHSIIRKSRNKRLN